MARRPRGWRLRTLLIAIAGLAVPLGVVRAMFTPYATYSFRRGETQVVYWSNGSLTEGKPTEPAPLACRYHRLVDRVEWSDGSTTDHLHWPRSQ
jgi:hypothetical protein